MLREVKGSPHPRVVCLGSASVAPPAHLTCIINSLLCTLQSPSFQRLDTVAVEHVGVPWKARNLRAWAESMCLIQATCFHLCVN